MKNQFFLSTVVLSIIFLSSCRNLENYSVSQQTYYGKTLDPVTVTWLVAIDPVSLDPHRFNDNPSWMASNQIFQGLTWFDQNHTLQPNLATSFEQIEPNTWRFFLRDNVYFHDGVPFNSYAVYRSLTRVIDPSTGSLAAPITLDTISSIEIIDISTVDIHTHFPFAPLPYHLSHSSAFIVSPEAINRELSGGYTVSELPIGTGPFAFVNRIHGDSILFQRNENYWDEPVSFEYLNWLVVPDGNTRLSMLETGQANGYQGSASNIPLYESILTIDFFINRQMASEFVSFNLNNQYLADINVRRAINYIIDRDAIVMINEGNATLATSSASPDIAFAPVGLEPIERNVEQALYHLGKSPWPDGGFTLNFWYHTGHAIRATVSELIQANMAELNIQANLISMEFGPYMEGVNAGEHDMFIMAWATVTGDADRAFFPIYHSENHGSMGNRSFFSDTLVDMLLINARKESDPIRRQYIYNQIGEIMQHYVPVMHLWHAHIPFPTNGIYDLHVDLRSIPFFQNVTVRR